MERPDMIRRCKEFFDELASLLSGTFEVIGSCNQDVSQYLVPIGTADQISYYGKPKGSFRISDHWNWYANVNKCHLENYIQCLSVDLPFAKRRFAPGKASKPIWGCQVSVVGEDGKYHCVFGESYDRRTKTWSWKEASAMDIIQKIT